MGGSRKGSGFLTLRRIQVMTSGSLALPKLTVLVIAPLQCDLERIQCTTDYISSAVSLTFETCQSAAGNRPAHRVSSTLLVPTFSRCLHRKQACAQGFLPNKYKKTRQGHQRNRFYCKVPSIHLPKQGNICSHFSKTVRKNPRKCSH